MQQRVMAALARRAGLRLFRFFERPLQAGAPSLAGELRLLAAADLGSLAADPTLDLVAARTSAALARGDLCVGAFEDGALAGYCWLAFAPLPHLDGVWVDFAPDAVWTYKSYVRPRSRGRGIARALYRFADRACLERGRRRSVICVESHNGSSIAAALGAGYRRAGWAAYLRGPAGLRAWRSPAARGVRFFDPAQGA